MSILDSALELYIKERIKEAPKKKLNDALNYRIGMFTVLCREAGYSEQQEFDILNKLFLPYLKQVNKDLESWDEGKTGE